MTDHLRRRLADAVRAAACTGDCGKTEEECAKERIQPFVWRHGVLAVVEASPEQIADTVLTALLTGAEREPRIRLDDLTSNQLDGLYDDLDRYGEVLGEMNEQVVGQAKELAALRAVARGYCEHCGRGDAAPTVADWETQRQRADQAEAAIARVHALHAPADDWSWSSFGCAHNDKHTQLCAKCRTCYPCPTITALDTPEPTP